MKQVKEIVCLEEGYLKLTLASKKEFDAYMLEELNKQPQALRCMAKKRSSICFLYDISERISLRRYFTLYEFLELEAWQFLSQLFSVIAQLEKTFPLCIDLDWIYCDQEGKEFYFMILPIHERKTNQDWGCFLASLVQELHISYKESLIASCFLITKQKELQPQDILAHLRLWKKQHVWWERLRRFFLFYQKRKERITNNHLRLQEEWTKLRLSQHALQEEAVPPVVLSSPTVALFPKSVDAYLQDGNGRKYPLKELNVIGRGETCTLQLNDDTISQMHAQIIKETHGYELIDLSSSNGTKLNGVKLKPQAAMMVKHEDQLEFASLAFTFCEEEGK